VVVARREKGEPNSNAPGKAAQALKVSHRKREYDIGHIFRI
jgi:hypothetical protein